MNIKNGQLRDGIQLYDDVETAVCLNLKMQIFMADAGRALVWAWQ